jgi:tetratricopeptide (TPR) repeat protein
LYLGHAYRNLGEYEAALELFQEVLIASQTADFIPIYAMALSASAQIYREFKQMDKAIVRHDSAIELLDKLGAKCDLAGAYAQRGLTYQALGEENKAWQDKGMAIGLFRAINVPKQVAWVEEVFRQNPVRQNSFHVCDSRLPESITHSDS